MEQMGKCLTEPQGKMPTCGHQLCDSIVVERGVCHKQQNLPAVMMGAPFKESKTENCYILFFRHYSYFFHSTLSSVRIMYIHRG